MGWRGHGRGQRHIGRTLRTIGATPLTGTEPFADIHGYRSGALTVRLEGHNSRVKSVADILRSGSRVAVRQQAHPVGYLLGM